jgi:hypothetical protein
MAENIDNVYFNDEPMQDKMPVFLKVLCILTFVSCGLSLLTTIYGLTIGDNLRESVMQMQQVSTGSGELDKMAAGMEANLAEMEKWTKYGHYLMLGNIALTLTGALMMWQRKKMGFFIYVFGQILPIISVIGSYSAMKNIPFMGVGVLIGAIFTVLFAVAFVIMYGVNLKHMR